MALPINMEINDDVDESSDSEDDIDHKYGGAHMPMLDDKVYQKLKQNDPGITTLHVSLNVDCFFNIIDWKENGDCIANNTHLKVIRITYYGSPLHYILGQEGHNLPTRQQFQDFFSCIYRNSSIKRLIISQMEIDEFGGRLIEGLSGHCLEELHILHLTLRGVVCKAIGNVLTHPMSKFKYIDLSSCNLDDENFGILCNALMGKNTLKRINIMYNKSITSIGWQSLSTVLKHPNCKLAKLSLSSAGLNDDAVNILGSALRGSSVKDLDISTNYSITNSGWQALINHLSQTSIEYLNFEVNEINDDDLAKLLDNIGMFKSLNLSSNNSITPAGWRSFFSTLRTRETQLVKLYISGTLIGSEDIQAFIGSLFSIRSTLRTLQMNDMDSTFTSQRWRTLFTTLQDTNLDLVKLSLCSNQIDDEGIRLLTRVVTNMTSLRYLRLEYNKQVTPVGWQALADYLQSPTCVLKELDLDDNNANDDLLIAFSGALVHNKTLEHLSFNECWDEENDEYDGTYVIAERGYEAVSALVCNKTSIIDTYNSNHTLNYVYHIRDNITSSYLALNENKDKAEVARQKILQTHFSTTEDYDSDMEDSTTEYYDSDTEDSDDDEGSNATSNVQEFLDMELKVMPTAIAWIGRPLTLGWRGENVSGLSLMFNLMRRLPDLFDSSPQKKLSVTKRKREDQ